MFTFFAPWQLPAFAHAATPALPTANRIRASAWKSANLQASVTARAGVGLRAFFFSGMARVAAVAAAGGAAAPSCRPIMARIRPPGTARSVRAVPRAAILSRQRLGALSRPGIPPPTELATARAEAAVVAQPQQQPQRGQRAPPAEAGANGSAPAADVVTRHHTHGHGDGGHQYAHPVNIHTDDAVNVHTASKQPFSSMPLSPATVQAMESPEGFGFHYMTEIQALAYQHLLAGEDLLARAKTGSGKTLAFMVPVVEALLRRRSSGIGALVLTPTRELALQIEQQVKVLLSFHASLSVFTVMGGTNMRTEAARLLGRQGPPSILIATPGRLVDHIQNTRGFTEALTRELRVLVLDEADRMLDQGFQPQMEKILAVLPRNGRQTALFSATLQGSVQGIKNLSLRADHAFVSTVREDEALTNARCKQEVVVAPDSAYFHTVAQILQANRHCKTIVFFPTTRLVDFAEEAFRLLGIPVVKLTGRMSQASRTRTFFSFCDAPGSAGGGSGGVMVCTDVAARGLDIPDVELIVQAGIPSAVEEYIHRIGRTARAGNTGRAVLVIREFESPFLSNLQRKNITLEHVAAPVEQASAEAARAAIQQLVRSDRELAKSAHNAYRTFLGYYVGACKQCGLSKPEMIARAFDFAYSIGIDRVGPIEARTVGKMGLTKEMFAAAERQYYGATLGGASVQPAAPRPPRDRPAPAGPRRAPQGAERPALQTEAEVRDRFNLKLESSAYRDAGRSGVTDGAHGAARCQR
eukprot:tig00020713_g13409.t1